MAYRVVRFFQDSETAKNHFPGDVIKKDHKRLKDFLDKKVVIEIPEKEEKLSEEIENIEETEELEENLDEVEEIEEAPKKINYDKMRVEELEAELDKQEIPYKKGITKKELLALLKK